MKELMLSVVFESQLNSWFSHCGGWRCDCRLTSLLFCKRGVCPRKLGEALPLGREGAQKGPILDVFINLSQLKANLLTKLAWRIGPYVGYLEPEYHGWTPWEKSTIAGQREGTQIRRNQPLRTPVWTFKNCMKSHMPTTYRDYFCRHISLLDEKCLGQKAKSLFSRKAWLAIFENPKSALRVANPKEYRVQ